MCPFYKFKIFKIEFLPEQFMNMETRIFYGSIVIIVFFELSSHYSAA